MNFDDVESLTLKMLETPENITSSDFLTVYNFVYKHCTQKSDVFVVRGQDVYNSLKQVLIAYFESLRPVTSLKSFNKLALKLQDSLKILTTSYSYLERYYIKSAINIRDGYTQDITTLSYNVFYSYYLSTYLNNIIDYIIYEIAFQRKIENSKYDLIAAGTSQLSIVLFYNDLEDVYEEFIEKYYKGFYKYIREESVTNIVYFTNREILHSKQFFSGNQKINLQKLTYCISRKFKDALNLFLEDYRSPKDSQLVKLAGLAFESEEIERDDRPIKNNLIEYFANLVQNMKEENANLFLNVLSDIVNQELELTKTVDELCFYYINIVLLFRRIPLITSSIYLTVKQFVERTLSNEDHVDIFIRLIDDIRLDSGTRLNSLYKNLQYKNMNKEIILELLMKLVKLSYLHEEIIKQTTLKIQQRFLTNIESYEVKIVKNDETKKKTLNFYDFKIFNNELTKEQNQNHPIEQDRMIIRSIEKVFGVSYISWLKIAIDRFLQPLSQSFGISNQENDLDAEMRLLTKGFWDVSYVPLRIHSTLKGIESILIKQNLLMFPKSEISTIYRISPAIFSLNGFDFRVSTDVLSLILYFQENNKLEEVMELAQDVNFAENHLLLLENHILLEKDGFYHINEDFSPNDYEIISKNCLSPKRSRGSPSLIDLFSVKFKTLTPEKNNPRMSHFESAIEAFCIRTLKKVKKMEICELSTMVQSSYPCTETQVKEILLKLERKEYVKIEDRTISYLV